MLYISFYREKHEFKLLIETIRPRVLIFGIYTKHHLVDLYQVCSKYAPGAKSGPIPGFTYRDIVSFQQIPLCKL